MKRVLAYVGVAVGGVLVGLALLGGATEFWAWFWGPSTEIAPGSVVDAWPLFLRVPTAALAVLVGVAGYLAAAALCIASVWYSFSPEGLREDFESRDRLRRDEQRQSESRARREQEEAERVVREYGRPVTRAPGARTARDPHDRIEKLVFIPADVYARQRERQRIEPPYTRRDYMSEGDL